MIITLEIETGQRDQMIDITGLLQKHLEQSKVKEGLMIVYSPHTTAGVTINENADPDVCRDFLRRLDEGFPWHHSLDRHGEGNSAAHLKTSTVGISQTIIISEGKLVLGRWQGVYFCEFDGPRSRKCLVKIISN